MASPTLPMLFARAASSRALQRGLLTNRAFISGSTAAAVSVANSLKNSRCFASAAAAAKDSAPEHEASTSKKVTEKTESKEQEQKCGGDKSSSEVVKLQEELAEKDLKLTEAKEKVDELMGKLRLSYADAENARKRQTVELDNAKKYAITKFAKTLVEVADNLERATEAVKQEDLKENKSLKDLYEGVKLTDSMLLKAFEKVGMTKFAPMGEKMDPNSMEAMFQMDSEEPKDTVVHVMQNGWKLNDRMVRAARVGTSKGPQVKKE